MTPSELWDVVRRTPDLSGEAKLAWFYLFTVAASGQLCTCQAHVGGIAADQGTTDRSASRALDRLYRAGLVHLVDRRGGRITIYLEDPVAVARARVDRALGAQQELEFDESDRATVGEQQHQWGDGYGQVGGDAADPRRKRGGSADLHHNHLERDLSHHLPLPSPFIGEDGNGDEGVRRKRGGTAEVIGDVLAEHRSIPSTAAEPEAIPANLQAYASDLRSRVGDPGLHIKPCLRIAEMVIGGRLKHSLVREALDDLCRAKTSRGAYFITTMQRIFREHGLFWPDKRNAG